MHDINQELMLRLQEEFKIPEDIKKYGMMIHSFAQTMKGLALLLKVAGNDYESIHQLVGQGPYNSLENKDFIHYGRYLTGGSSGLFGAFAIIHRPELAFTRKLPKLLGQRGFKLRVKQGTKEASWPLDKITFGFIPRETNGLRAPPGKVCIGQGLASTELSLPAGTILTSDKDARRWRMENNLSFEIVDDHDRPVKENVATTILWAHITAAGLKKHGKGTPKFNTIARDGIDDDFNAEHNVAYILNHLQAQHDIDLMPEFHSEVVDAAKLLQKEPDMLLSIGTARKIVSELRDSTELSVLGKYPNYLYTGQLQGVIPTWHSLLRNWDNFIQLLVLLRVDSPDACPANAQPYLEKIVSYLKGKLSAQIAQDRVEKAKAIADFICARYIKQVPNPFSELWTDRLGNRLTPFDTEYKGRLREEFASDPELLPLVVSHVETLLRKSGLADARRNVSGVINGLHALKGQLARRDKKAVTRSVIYLEMIERNLQSDQNNREITGAGGIRAETVSFESDYLDLMAINPKQHRPNSNLQAGIQEIINAVKRADYDLHNLAFKYGTCVGLTEALGELMPEAHRRTNLARGSELVCLKR